MTSNERKIINCLWETKGKTHIRLVAQKANLSSDYARLLCRSLARSGHIKFENDLAYLLKKGRSRFDASTSLSINPEPVERIENNDPATGESMAVAASVTLLTDEPVVVSPASERNDEEENQEEDVDASEDNGKDKPASSDEELDNTIADLELSSKKDESEEKGKPEEPKDETENESSEKEEEKTEKIAEEPKEEINTDKKKDALNKEIFAETEATGEEKIEKPDETELKSELKAKEEKPAVAEAMADKEKELTEAEMKTVMDTADGKEEAKAENSEKVALKEEYAKPSGGFGARFKKIVPIAKISRILDKVGINWFAEKK